MEQVVIFITDLAMSENAKWTKNSVEHGYVMLTVMVKSLVGGVRKERIAIMGISIFLILK